MANGIVSLKISLNRALVIAHDLGNEKMINWITKELYGYDDSDVDIPKYRILSGQIKMTYLSGYQQISNQPVSSLIIPEEIKEWRTYKCKEGMSVIEEFVGGNSNPAVSLVDILPFIKKNSPFQQFQDMWMELSKTSFMNIIDSVSKELMEMLLKIDNEIGNVDELDISPSEEQLSIINNYVNIKIDSFTSIGNNNDIKNTDISGKEIVNYGKK